MVRFRTVTVASTDGATVSLTDGLKAGERIVINLPNEVTNGSRVQPVTMAQTLIRRGAAGSGAENLPLAKSVEYCPPQRARSPSCAHVAHAPGARMSGALDGIRVVELANYVSGPYAGMMLARPRRRNHQDRGAGQRRSVPRLGPRRLQPALRLGEPQQEERHARPQDRQGQAAAAKLIADRRRGDREFPPRHAGPPRPRLRRARAGNPRLIWCSITGFGTFGPSPTGPGYDTVGQAMGGLLSVLTDMDAPKPMGISFSDHLAGMVACNGILAALQARDRTGKGQRVDTSLLEATVSFFGENAARYFENGKVPAAPPAPTPRRSMPSWPATASRSSSICRRRRNSGRGWRASPAIRNGSRTSASIRARRGRRITTRCTALLSEVFATKDREHWLRRLTEEDVPSGPLYDFAEVFADPQVQALDMRVQRAAPEARRGRPGAQRLAAVRHAGAGRSAVARSRRAQPRDSGE